MKQHNILIVTDLCGRDRLIDGPLRWACGLFTFVLIQGFDEGMDLINEENFDVVLVDLDQPAGLDTILNRLRDASLTTPVVVLTGRHNASLGRQALQLGVYDHFVFGQGDDEALLRALRHIAERGETERALLECEARYHRLLKSVTDYVYTVSVENDRAVSSWHGPGCAAVTGYASEEYTADPYLWYRMIHEEDRPGVLDMTNQVLSRKTPPPLEHRIIHKDGSIRWIKNAPVPHYDQQGRLISYDGLVSDITERKVAEEKLRHAAYYDGLTDLPNRMLFSDRLRQALIQTRRHNRTLAVMFLDLDRFKCINDTLGHKIGDVLLRSVSERLLHCVREGDTVARLSGDEFIILLADMARGRDAAIAIKKIYDALSKGFPLAGQEFFITASCGISLFPSDGTDSDTLIKNADVAMYQAKKQGRNNYQFYTTGMNTKALRSLVLESNLRKALDQDEFIIYYQPLIELATGRISGTEALMRWQHPALGLLLPAEFIPMAEEIGLIMPMGEWLLEKVCRQAKAWNESALLPYRMSVNLSMRQFTHNAILGSVAKALSRSGLDPHLLELELTESMIMQNAQKTIATLHELRATGIQLSLDDFGTGYSSLSYLKNLPLNKLKLDQSFVSALARETTNEAILKAIIGLAHNLNLQVIAEGVESFDQLELLRFLQCDEVQGYLFSRPVPAREMTLLIEAEKNRMKEPVFSTRSDGLTPTQSTTSGLLPFKQRWVSELNNP